MVSLEGRDGKTLLIVSYSDVADAIQESFNELVSASASTVVFDTPLI